MAEWSSAEQLLALGRPAWFDLAACRGVAVAVFFSDDPAPARAVCSGCEVRLDCFRWAGEARIRFGMFGGLGPEERRGLARRCGGRGEVSEVALDEALARAPRQKRRGPGKEAAPARPPVFVI